MISRTTQWRVLKLGVSNGADVRDLEELLTSAGHGEGLVVDKRFSSITAQRIKDWERDIGRASPDGKVQIGDLVTVPAQHRVLGHLAVLGDEIASGVSVLSLGGEEKAVVVSVPADEVEQWTPGAPAILRWSDGEEGKGTVSGVGRKVSDGAVEVVVDTVSGGKGAGDRATVALVPPISAKVLAVPVAAVMTGPSGAPALQRPDGAYIDVELGTFADGWVEVTGVNEGTQVRLPS